MPFEIKMLGNGRKSPTSFSCPSCAKKLYWKKWGEWSGSDFGFLFCSSHRFPMVWGIPIFLDQERKETVSFLIKLVEKKRFQESLEIALASSIDKLFGSFPQRRTWVGRILPFGRAGFEAAISPLPKMGQDFFLSRFSDPSFRRLCVLSRELAKGKKGPLLDLGCGTAALAYALRTATPKVPIVSLDLNFHFLYCGRRFFRTDSIYVCADVHHQLPFSPKSFGGIVCCRVSKEIKDQGRFLEECERLIHPLGFLCWQPW